MPIDVKYLPSLLAAAKVLVVDDEPYMRKVVRTLLISTGVRTVYEAPGATAGLTAVRELLPDAVILDWEMPGVDGAEFMRMLRSPGTFPYPDVPVIMLTGHSERRRVIEAITLGVNEFLLKPVSSKTLRERLVAVLANPRPIVWQGDYYGPVPRKLATSIHTDGDEAVANLVMLN